MNKINDDKKKVNSIYSLFKISIMKSEKNIDDETDRILAFMKFLSI